MFGAIAFLVVLTIPEVINNHAFRIWSHHPLDNHFVAGTVPQLRSLTSGPNPLGTLLSVFAALVVLQVKNTIWRYCLLAVTGIASGLTYARSAWLGTAVMGAGVFIKSLRTKKIIYWPLFLGLFILVGTALGAVRYHTPISDILLHGKSTESHGVTAAKAIQSETKQFALTVVGYGIGTAGPVVYGTPLENTGKYPTITESWYLQLIQEIGLIGIILYGWLYYGLIRSLFKQDSNSIVGWLAIGLAVNAVFLHTWSSDANLNLMFWALAGLTLFSRPTKQLA
jgi:hypothetical protein